jgi:hypothetical protein
MDIDRVNRWLTLLANIGVLAGILFLAIEIQLSNRIAIASMEIEMTNHFASINESVYTNPVVAALVMKASSPDADLTPAEEEMLTSYCYRFHNVWSALEIADSKGLLPPDSFGVIEPTLRSILRRFPRTEPIFREMLDELPSLNERRVNQIIRKVLEEQKH